MQHEVSEHELAGGAKLLAVDTPGAISFYFSSHVRNGYRFCDPKIYEVPHLLEHLSFEGNKRYPEPIEFKSAIERLGATYNASTSNNQVQYYFIAGTDHQQAIVELALDQVLAPAIDPVRVDQQKAVIDQELRRRMDNDGGNCSYYNWRKIFPGIWPDWPDRLERLAGITAEDVRAYWERTHGTSNLRFVAAGDFGKDGLAQMIEQLNRQLSRHPKGTALEYTPLKMGRYQQTVSAFPAHIPSQHHFQLTFLRRGWDEQLSPALLMLNCMLSVGLASRMQMKARERGLTYTFSGGFSRDIDSTDLWMGDQTAPDKLYDLVELAVGELSSVARAKVTESEMERARGLIVGSLQRGYQTPANLASWYDYRFLYDQPRKTVEDWIAGMRKVDLAAIRKAGAKYVTPDNWALTLVGTGLDAETDRYKKLLTSAFA